MYKNVLYKNALLTFVKSLTVRIKNVAQGEGNQLNTLSNSTLLYYYYIITIIIYCT